MQKQDEKAALPLLKGGQFRFVREQAGFARHQFASFAGISVSTIRIVEVWKKSEQIKIAYIKKLRELVGEEVFAVALKLYKKMEREETLGYHYRID
jgi:DNA-binding XRE family transcriptional regulator